MKKEKLSNKKGKKLVALWVSENTRYRFNVLRAVRDETADDALSYLLDKFAGGVNYK